jgi:LysM repeat protein
MRYTFSAPDTQIPTIRVLRGNGGPKIESGYAKWTVADRPKRKGATIYAGSDPLGLAIPIIFDGWSAEDPIEDDIRDMLRMQHEIGGEPPRVQVNVGIAGGLPLDVRGMDFLITSIEWGDDQIWDTGPNGSLVRYRQDATVHLLEKVDPTVTVISAKLPGNTRGTKPSGTTHASTWHVKKGDTLTAIAVKVYHDRSRWRDIATANKIADPRNLKVGQTLRLPK